MTMPRISVIVPTFNRVAYLADAIRSVQAQNYRDIEIIVADDGSTDNTAEIAAQFGSSVTYLSLTHHGLPAATRNAGLRAARGEFIAFLDSDDLFLPGKLELQLATFDAHPEAGLVYSNGHFFRDAPNESIGDLLDGLPSPSGNVFAELLRGNFVFTPTVLVRRACLDSVSFFDERPDFFAVEDYDLWLRIAAQFPIIYAPGKVAAVRRHGQSISRDVVTLRGRVLQVLAKIEQLYPNLVHEYTNARHEAYARNHGAIALAQFQQKEWAPAFWHGCSAMAHTLRMSGFGLAAFLAWRRRRRLRESALV